MLGVRVRGILAWFVRRTYYLMQMPGWGRRIRIVIDWTFALLFRPDVVKISVDSEAASLIDKAELDAAFAKLLDERAARTGHAGDGVPDANGLGSQPGGARRPSGTQAETRPTTGASP
jgi:hypothetical protein